MDSPTKMAPSLEAIWQEYRSDPERLAAITRLFAAQADWVQLDDLLANFDDSEFARQIDAIDPVGFTIFERVILCALLATNAEASAHTPAEARQRRTAVYCRDRLWSIEPILDREAFPAIWAFLVPMQQVDAISDRQLEQGLLCSARRRRFERASESADSRKSYTDAKHNRRTAANFYVDAIRKSDPRAKSLHAWATNPPREVSALYGDVSKKTIMRSLNAYVAQLSLETREQLRDLQAQIGGRKLRRKG